MIPKLTVMLVVTLSLVWPANFSRAQEHQIATELRAAARDSYIFTYPLAMMYRTMYLQAVDESSPSFSGGMGKWLHLGVATPADTDIVTPNNDTPYSYAWVDLLQQSTESLAARIACTELSPLLLEETGAETAEALWLRGGFPDSFTAPGDAASLEWRRNFIRHYR